MAELPGPFRLPVIGNLHQLKNPTCLTFAKFGNIHGDVYQLQLGSTKTVILNSAEALRQAFDKQGEVFSFRDENFTSFKLYNEVRGDENAGVTVRNANTDVWYVQHMLVGRAMKYYMFEADDNRFEKSIRSDVSKLISTWISIDQEEGFLIDPVASCQELIGHLKADFILGDVCDDIEDFDKKLEAYSNASVEMLAMMRGGFVNDFLPFLGFLTKSKQSRMREILSVGAQFFEDIYKAHAVSYQCGSKETIMDCVATFQDEMEKEHPDRTRVPRKTVFGVIAELFEGVANASAALLQIMMYMIEFPEVQEKVREELREVVGASSSSYPSLEHREKLAFTEAVMYEVWRHSSVIKGTVPHTCNEDVLLGGSYNFLIPKGATVIGNLYSVHKDPKIWDQPSEFNPMRFLKQEDGSLDEEKVTNCMVFSIGKRSCIAELLTKRELLLVYSTLIHLCKFENVGSSLTMQEVGGFEVPRDGSLKIKITRTGVDVSSNV
ncbi:cytochrome P450 1A1-like [Apostichopus japonicus]|uniref:cytochrome P450 1A1-like n=1 Tax=Stichopus japonicus TaxID=307972 RepID=UPI003AB1B238